MKAMATIAGLCLIALTGCEFTSDSAEAQSPPEIEGLELRRLWTGGDADFYAQSISPDGRFITFIDWDVGELAVRDPVTGDEVRITDQKQETFGADSTLYQGPGISVFSRDGHHIAYAWQVGDNFELRALDFTVDAADKPSGSHPRILYQKAGMVPYTPLDWSPDGESVLVTISSALTHTNTLSLVASDGSSSEALKSFDWREPGRAKFSPDGRFIAYDFPADTDSPERDLFLVSVDGTREVRLTSGPSHDRLLDWHPGGILFQRTRGGTPGVWLLPMEEGRAAGDPVLLKADTWGHEPIGAANGAYYFGVVAERPTLYTAAVDLVAARLTSTPVALEDAYGGIINRGWDWSPDGRSIAHLVNMRGAPPELIIRSPDGEELHRIRLELRGARDIRWAPDGTAIFVAGRDRSGERGFHRVEIESGSQETVLRSGDLSLPAYEFLYFDVSRDGRTLYLDVSAGDNAPMYLIAFDLQSREERNLGEVDWPGHVARSPDGSALAIATRVAGVGRHVSVMTLDNARVEPVYDLSPPAGRTGYVDVRGLDWTPDGEAVIVNILGPGGGIWKVPVHGGDPQRFERIAGLRLYWRPVRLSPDGRNLAFMAGRFRGEIWVMEGITDVVAGARDAR